MAVGSNGYRAALVRRQLTPGLISSLPGTAGLPQFISFSTNYPELPQGHTERYFDRRLRGRFRRSVSGRYCGCVVFGVISRNPRICFTA
jgi:hypothetical protein